MKRKSWKNALCGTGGTEDALLRLCELTARVSMPK